MMEREHSEFPAMQPWVEIRLVKGLGRLCVYVLWGIVGAGGDKSARFTSTRTWIQIPTIHVKCQAWLACCNPCLGADRARQVLRAYRPARLAKTVSFQLNDRPCFRTVKWYRKTLDILLWIPSGHVQLSTCMGSHTYTFMYILLKERGADGKGRGGERRREESVEAPKTGPWTALLHLKGEKILV